MAIKSSGYIFIEILIAIALISMVFVVLLGLSFQSVNLSSSIQKKTQADAYVREELEELRSFRDGTTWTSNGLGTVTVGQNYYLTFNSGTNKYQLNSGTETVSGFTRSLVFNQVQRDGSGTIVSSGGTVDTNTMKATATITGNSIAQQQVVVYLTNWQNK